jgi:transcription antitermination factor NusG
MLTQTNSGVSNHNAWFALQIKCRYENFTANLLSQKGFEVFAPSYPGALKQRIQKQELELPLFPGYVFARFDATRRLPILTTPGVYAIVGYGKVPTVIPDEEVLAIRSALLARMTVEPCSFLNVGTSVRIVKGPLMGREGILVENRSDCYVVLSVSTIERSVRVHVRRDDVVAQENRSVAAATQLAYKVS